MKKQSRISIMEHINIVCSLIFCGCYVTPYISYHVSNVLQMLVFFILMTSTILVLLQKRDIVDISKFILLILLWLFYVTFMRVIGYSTTLWGNILIKYFYVVPIIMGIIYTKYMSNNACRRFYYCLFGIFIFNILDNIRLLRKYPGSSEALNFAWGKDYFNYNIGGTIFSLCTLLVALFILSQVITNKKYRLIGFILYILCCYYVYSAGRGIALIFLLIGSLMIIFNKVMINNNQKSKAAVILFIGFVCIAILPFLSYILLMISQSISSVRLASRITELAKMLQFNAVYDDTSSGVVRLELYMLSVKTFLWNLQNFLIGVGEHTFPDSIAKLYIRGVGKHSQLLDTAAEYGIIGVIFILSILKYAYKKLFDENVQNRSLSYMKIVFFIYILFSFVNNTFSIAVHCIVFWLLPTYIKIHSTNKKGVINVTKMDS